MVAAIRAFSIQAPNEENLPSDHHIYAANIDS